MIIPLLVAAGSAVVAAVIVRSQAQAGVARERAAAAEAQLVAERERLEERLRATEEAARRKALEEFLDGIRVEDRHFIRESAGLLASKKSVVIQERLYFRNIPITDWVEREYLVEQSAGTLRKALEPNNRKLLE